MSRGATIRVIIADPDAVGRARLRRRLATLCDEILEASDASSLGQLLASGPPARLVIASAAIGTPSPFELLARSRQRGARTPFLVITSTHEGFYRVFVSDAEGSVLSSRMVDRENLGTLAESMLVSECG